MNVLDHAMPRSIMASCSSVLRFLAIGLLIGTIYAERKLFSSLHDCDNTLYFRINLDHSF